MRRSPLPLAAALITSACTVAPAAPSRIAQSDAEFARLTAGKFAQAPISCVPQYRSNDMVVVDESRIAFKDGRRVYIAQMNGPCANLGAPGYALLTRNYGSSGLCRGDIAQVIDTSAHLTVGSCTFGDVTPYVPAAG